MAIATALFGQVEPKNLEGIIAHAEDEDKNILLVFSGSDWCKPCIQLKAQILESNAFKDEKENWIYLYLDFPYKKSNQLSKEERNRNERLAELYNPQGQFPFIAILDQEGNLQSTINYSLGMKASDFIQKIRSYYEG